MINLALALAFAVSVLFNPGDRLLDMAIDTPVLQSLPPYQGHLLLVFANLWIPTVLFYLALRLTQADRLLRPHRTIHVFLGLANLLLLLYGALKILASTVQGGAVSFIVISFAPFILLPAWSMLIVGLGWTMVRSIRLRGESVPARARLVGAREGIAVIAALGLPILGAATTMFLTGNAPFTRALEAKNVFLELCKKSGEKIYERPHDVRSVYLDPDSAVDFQSIVNGVYSGIGGGILGEGLVNGGLILYFERKDERPNFAGQYLKYTLRHWEPVQELTSDYGVFQKDLVSTDEAKRLQVGGNEITVKNIKTGQVIATLVYFVSHRHRAICGHSADGQFSVGNFIRQSLNLTRRFPTELSKP